tara:strand:- start:2624 stop:3223 length:600 start_codon:yes stop_codon:yes gene_type:complete
MKRTKRKLNMVVPKNNQVVAVDKTLDLATHKSTSVFISNYSKNLNKALAWVKDQKKQYYLNYTNAIKATISKIKLRKKLTSTEASLLLRIVSKYEVIDKSFIRFHDRKKFVLIPKKMKRIELKENKKHIIHLSRKRKYQDLDDAEDSSGIVNEKTTPRTEEEIRQERMYLWGFGKLNNKKKKRISKKKKNSFKRITDYF